MSFINKENFSELKKRTKFYQGLILGLFITSGFSFAVVTFNSFTAGTPISSSQVNANFAAIKTKLDEFDIGYVGKISTDLILTCRGSGSYPTHPTDFDPVVLTTDYTDGNFDTNMYTVPSAGLYRFFFYSPSEDNMGFDASVDMSTDAGTTWTQIASGSMSQTNSVVKLNADDLVRVSAGCGTMAGTDSTIDSSKFLFAIKKF